MIEGTVSAKAANDEAILRGEEAKEEEEGGHREISELENEEGAPREEIAFTLGPEGFK